MLTRTIARCAIHVSIAVVRMVTPVYATRQRADTNNKEVGMTKSLDTEMLRGIILDYIDLLTQNPLSDNLTDKKLADARLLLDEIG